MFKTFLGAEFRLRWGPIPAKPDRPEDKPRTLDLGVEEAQVLGLAVLRDLGLPLLPILARHTWCALCIGVVRASASGRLIGAERQWPDQATRAYRSAQPTPHAPLPHPGTLGPQQPPRPAPIAPPAPPPPVHRAPSGRGFSRSDRPRRQPALRTTGRGRGRQGTIGFDSEWPGEAVGGRGGGRGAHGGRTAYLAGKGRADRHPIHHPAR